MSTTKTKPMPNIAGLKPAHRVGGARRARIGRSVRARKIQEQRRNETQEAIEYSKQARAATKSRYKKGDVFESDSIYTMQYKNAESNDLFARKDDAFVQQPLTSEQLHQQEEEEDPEGLAERERVMTERLTQLEEALPETVRKIDNLSEAHRKGERKTGERFHGSFINYVFRLQKEVEKEKGRERKDADEREWVAWLEKMYRKHQPFSDDHYQVFRKICEGRLNEDPTLFKLLYLRALVEKGVITLAECNKLGSEYTTIQTMYPAMRAQVEHHRRLRAQGIDPTKLAAANAKDEENIADHKANVIINDASYVGGEGQWQWWSGNANDEDEKNHQIPKTFVQWCLSVQFAAETSDLQTITDVEAYEVLCCSSSSSDTKQIRFFKAGASCDDFAQHQLSDSTVRSWLGDPVQDARALNTEAHLFILDRSGGSRDKWVVTCYNINEDAIGWEEAIAVPTK